MMIYKLNLFIKRHLLKKLPVNLLFIYILSHYQVSGQNDTTHIKQQKSKATERNISLFNSDELLEITLYLDLAGFSKKPQKDESFVANMTIHFSETDSLKKKQQLNIAEYPVFRSAVSLQ